MITQNAIVTKTENQQVWIENQQQTACRSCLQKDNCTSSILQQWLPKRMIQVHTNIPLKPGDDVVVAIDDKRLLQATLLLYLLPLLFMFFGAGLSSWMFPDQVSWIIFSSIGSLIMTFFIINKLLNTLFIHNTANLKIIDKVSSKEVVQE